MKKICFLLFFAANVLPTSCAEKAPKQFHTNCEGIFPAANPSTLTPSYIKNPFQIVPYIPPIVTNNWKIYNDIMNIPYKRDQPVTSKDIELKPVYYPASIRTNNPSQSTQPPVKSDTDLIEQLYNGVSSFLSEVNQTFEKIADDIADDIEQAKIPLLRMFTIQPRDAIIKQLYINGYDCFESVSPRQSLSLLIKNMNYAKENGITEDMMGKFSMDRWFSISSYGIYHTALLFNCLKQYALTPNQIEKPMSNTLSSNLGIVTNFISQEILEKALKTLKESQYRDGVIDLARSLYENEKIILDDSLEGHYTDLTKDFYQLASNLFIDINKADMYQLLQIIDNAKTEYHDIQEETDLGYTILTSPMDKLSDPSNEKPQHSISDLKNRISLLCIFIKIYNQARGNKITPTTKHFNCYQLKKAINLALPDSFNSTLFDKKFYAFAEISQLMDHTRSLIKAEDQEVQLSVDKLYPQRT